MLRHMGFLWKRRLSLHLLMGGLTTMLLVSQDQSCHPGITSLGSYYIKALHTVAMFAASADDDYIALWKGIVGLRPISSKLTGLSHPPPCCGQKAAPGCVSEIGWNVVNIRKQCSENPPSIHQTHSTPPDTDSFPPKVSPFRKHISDEWLVLLCLNCPRNVVFNVE